MAFVFSLIVLLFLSSAHVFGQSVNNESVFSDEKNEARIAFDKLLNRYHWDTRIRYGGVFEDISFLVNQNFKSSLITSDRKFIRDEHTLGFDMRHPYGSRFKGVLRASSYTLSDDQTIVLGKAGSHTLQYGVEASPFAQLTITPMLGIRFDNQVGREDKGMVYSLGVNSSGMESGGYGITVGGYNELALLTPRRLETLRDTLGIRKNFFTGTETQFAFSYLRHRREFYLGDHQSVAISGGGPAIETRTENVLAFTAGLEYGGGRVWQFAAHGSLLSRDVGRTQNLAIAGQTPLSPGIEEFRLEGDALVRYSPRQSFSVTAAVAMLEREEQHSIIDNGGNTLASIDSAESIQERKNNQARRTSLMADIRYVPSHSDTLMLSLSNSILRYDTPSDGNNDDRDELRHTIRLTTLHRVSGYLHVEIIAEAGLTHLVYLTRYRSSENTWNRIFRLAPRLRYAPYSMLTTVNTFEVLANYTAYDFEYLSSSIRSFTFRQFGWVDSSAIWLTKRMAVDWFSAIRLYERGELQWEAFSERPLTSIEEQTYTGSVRYTIREHLLFSIGIRYFSQTRFAYTGADKRQEFFLRSVGPVTAIDWSVGMRTRLLVKGWYENLLQTGQMNTTNANMTLQCTVQL